MKVVQQDTTKAAVYARHDEIGARLKMNWNAQAVGKKAVFSFFADAMGLEKGSKERVELAKQWEATPAWFGVNLSAGKNARNAAKSEGGEDTTDYSQD